LDKGHPLENQLGPGFVLLNRVSNPNPKAPGYHGPVQNPKAGARTRAAARAGVRAGAKAGAGAGAGARAKASAGATRVGWYSENLLRIIFS
jgi:hypothetical protein